MSIEIRRRIRKRMESEKRKRKERHDKEIESMKQKSREFTKEGKIEKATELFNTAWDLEHGFKRNDMKNKRFPSQKHRSLH